MTQVLDKFGNHLEFLGYKIEKIEPKEEGEVGIVIATHPQNNNIVFFEMMPNFVIFQVSLSTKKSPSSDMDAFLNNANKHFYISKLFYKVDANLAVIKFEAVYTGDYSKELFAQFYDLFEKDQNLLGSLDNFTKVFLD